MNASAAALRILSPPARSAVRRLAQSFSSARPKAAEGIADPRASAETAACQGSLRIETTVALAYDLGSWKFDKGNEGAGPAQDNVQVPSTAPQIYDWRYFMQRASKRWIPWVLMGLVVSLAACQQQPQQPPTPPDTRAADEAAIRNLDTQWSQAAAAKNVDQFVAAFADGANFFPPNQPAITAKEGIQKWASDLMANPGFAVSWTPTKAEVARSSDLGYTLGTYELTLQGPKGKTMTDHGKYLTVWKKQADGSWKVAADVFNSDLPPAGAASK